MEVGNEMEILITLTKYNTLQWHEEGKPLLVVTTKSVHFTHFTIVSNKFMRNGAYSIMLMGRVYNTNVSLQK